ncbi:PAS domain-containing sensor histidine kinase [Nitratidesulfovibrio liaohensis]|uniref:histidine kinase n=1 Tax=Nitratidesulfovibrio liaohensis TaxID=2604158 RepID=A0ABY9QZG1_9BACT|nr:PAS domain-containing sensor histidine kinase [Nitratidesulfovibrio liaohensis]WMW64913.1 PAS domain-containing sensor histidine kinase [Nitratidesulfovibrio liaohensis]
MSASPYASFTDGPPTGGHGPNASGPDVSGGVTPHAPHTPRGPESPVDHTGPHAPLPTLQKRIRRDFLRLVGLFGVLGIVLVGAVFAAGRMPNLLVRMNYDSIAWVREMETAMNGLRFAAQYPERDGAGWAAVFEAALDRAERNITEPDEPQALADIRAARVEFHRAATGARPSPAADIPNVVNAPGAPDTVDAAHAKLRATLSALVEVNERGMFRRLDRNTLLRDATVLGAAALFLAGTLWAVLLADGIAARVSHPLRRAAEVFKERPRLGAPLHLPPPQTLEVRVLFDELVRLWGRLSELDALNVGSLTAEKRKLEVILESADDAILVLDGTGTVAHVSERMLPLIGLPREQVLGMPRADLSTAAPNYLALRGALDASLHGKRDVPLTEGGEERVFVARRRDLVGGDAHGMAADGGDAHGLASDGGDAHGLASDGGDAHGMPEISGHDGRGPALRASSTQRASTSASASPTSVVGQVFLLGDVTEARRREGLRSEMMDWVSHELKTPMQSLCLAADLLDRRKDDLDAEGRLLVETVREDAARLRTLAQQFMDIARMTPSALHLTRDEADLPALLDRWLTPFVLLARETGVRLAVDVRKAPEKVRLDAERFAWVVSNLVANALRASPTDGEVRVRVTEHQGRAVIEVEDEGAGLPEAVQARLFQPFAHGPAAGARGGLYGLGLAITRSIVDAHGGHIAYERREERGSRFTVTLPLPPRNDQADDAGMGTDAAPDAATDTTTANRSAPDIG